MGEDKLRVVIINLKLMKLKSEKILQRRSNILSKYTNKITIFKIL